MVTITSSGSGNSSSASEVGGSSDLLSEILSRVPARPLFRFKCVSHNWLRVISNRRFALLQSKRNPTGSCSGIIAVSSAALPSRSTPPPASNFDFFWISNRRKFVPPPPALAFLESMSCSGILQSCNGLLLCSSTRSDCAYFVCNPVLGKFRRIDLPEEASGSGNWKVLGLTLAFDPSRWSGFKVICSMSGAIDVYSSDEGSWKRVIQGPIAQSNLALDEGIYWNGKAIWLPRTDPFSLGDRSAVYYLLNLEKESLEAQHLPCPNSTVRYLGESLGRLTLVSRDREAIHVYEMGGDLVWEEKHREMDSVMRARLNPPWQAPLASFVWDGSWVVGVVRDGEEGLLVVWFLPAGAGRVVAYNCRTGLVASQAEWRVPGKTRQFIESLYWIPQED